MPRSRSSSTNGGVIRKKNLTSFGKCVVTTKTSTGTVCLQSGTRVIDYLLVAGGGGGATAAGSRPAGGAGAPNLITGSDVTYATGGAGAPGSPNQAGTANEGDGGNAAPGAGGNAGGSGVVIVRFPGSTCASVAPGTNSLTSCVGPANDKVARFTVSGTLTIS